MLTVTIRLPDTRSGTLADLQTCSWLSVFETIVCSKNKFLSFFAMRSKPLWHLVAILASLVVPAVKVLSTRPMCNVFQSAIAIVSLAAVFSVPRKMSAPTWSTVK